MAQRPHDVPQQGQLHVRRREQHLRRLLRPRRPVHRAARGGLGHDRHLQGVGGLRRRRLPDRHGQARQHRVLAVVHPRDPRRGQQHRQPEVLRLRRGLRRRRPTHVPVRHRGRAPGHARLPVPGEGPGIRHRQGDDRAARRLLRRRLVHRRRRQRLLTAHVPRQPRHGPHRQVHRDRACRERRRRRSCSATSWRTR